MPEVSSWRATFRNPKLREDQLAIRIPVAIKVEVYRKSRYRWDAREPVTKTSYEFSGVESDTVAKSRIESMFRECVEPWKAYDALGNPITGEMNAV